MPSHATFVVMLSMLLQDPKILSRFSCFFCLFDQIFDLIILSCVLNPILKQLCHLCIVALDFLATYYNFRMLSFPFFVKFSRFSTCPVFLLFCRQCQMDVLVNSHLSSYLIRFITSGTICRLLPYYSLVSLPYFRDSVFYFKSTMFSL